ncbi:unnamed protein product (macronuclear) [Paramecium tetraurelia]|uniref:Vacuole membrane protein 1 n=1 Tax=Paramecium tetraurelia TaxID=5888 RepID=A0C2G3_PARTE|nr:uncharacterized protein GSPATT00034458001 [Paramecium tetraurelia]CAK64980.1 unnamed protein product [Paramecium tetraurelia]|eukprot:XP_001432377.1 hypothetical protein (macronuclear) [Paramecium tetraurelia strain d4-2]
MVEAPTLFSNPIKTLYLFSIVLFNYAKDAVKYLSKFWHIIGFLALIVIAPRFVEGEHSELVRQGDEIAYFMLYWLVLGIMSSVGLGTGLHTFVLYLGPHIAKTTIQAYECNALPLFVPSKYATQYVECPKEATGIAMFDIVKQVYFETVLFGIGTAIGELPPYFVARAAALANKKLEELEEVLEKKDENTFMHRMKLLIYNKLQKNAFLTVMLCASIPNPLFDLAGITCGHFLISFWTFFGATVLGKGIHQNAHSVTHDCVCALLSLIQKYVPFIYEFLSELLDKQRKQLRDPSLFKEGTKPLLAQLWDYFIILMIGFFMISIVNSLVAQYVSEQEQEKKKDKQHQHHSNKHHAGDHKTSKKAKSS